MPAFDPDVFDFGTFDAEAPAVPGPGSWWGGWFPRGAGKSWWGYPERTWYPEGSASETTPGALPETVGLFLLESGSRLTLTYRTAIHKSYNGRERRAGLIDDPHQRFDGPARLNNAETRARRALLARYAAQGLPFSLAMPWEALTVKAESTGTTVAVHSTALSDWVVVGARCVVTHATYGSMEGVVQSSTSTTITLDVTLGSVGSLGAMIMPTIQVFLDAQQQFARYPVNAERWTLGARAAVAGLSSSALKASLALEAPLTNSGVLDGMRLEAITAGADGNLISVTQSDDALTSGGELIEDVTAKTLHIKYMGDTTTLLEYVALVAASSLVRLLGTYTSADVLASADDEFAATTLSGGADPQPVTIGIGATLTTFAGRAIWDRGVKVDGAANDSMQSMSETLDFGGLPFSTGMTSVPDWGRDVKIEGRRASVEFQWFKLFLSTVQGAWKSWWLPTYRADLVWISSAAGTVTVDSAGEPSVWWPNHQTHVMILQASGAITYARVTACVDNGDDTSTLTIVDEADVAITLSGSAVTIVSWLELVRLEDSGGVVQVPVEFKGTTFSAQMTARVVKQAGTGALATAQDYEQSVEDSAPREGVEWELPEFTQRDSTSTRDVTINGAKFTARASGRAEISVPVVGEDADLIISVPLTHAAALRWLRGGQPPRDVTVNVWRRQTAGDHETVYRGVITSMAMEGNHTARFRVSSKMAVTLARRLPTLTAGRSCGHLLYDEGCQVNRTTASGDRTVTLVDGREVTFTPAFGAGTALKYGILKRASTGEEMTIADHVGDVVTLQFPIYGLTAGDTVTLSPGCDHLITTCRDSFSNVANFGNAPNLPTKNVFEPDGLSVTEQV